MMDDQWISSGHYFLNSKLWPGTQEFRRNCTGISQESVHFHKKNIVNKNILYNPIGAYKFSAFRYISFATYLDIHYVLGLIYISRKIRTTKF
jgi:hypothetical protein